MHNFVVLFDVLTF